MQTTNYAKNEELANSITHGFGVLMALVAAYIILQKAYDLDIKYSVISTSAYIFVILFSYGSSTLYHAFAPGPKKKLFRKFDHAAIYIHIAGTYTPFCIIVLIDYEWWGYGLFIFTWLAAILGVILSFTHLKGHSRLSTFCYVLMGSCVVIAIKTLYEALSSINPYSFYLLLGGGLAFIVGALFYSLHKRPFMHSIFHVFCILGSICHIIAIYYILI